MRYLYIILLLSISAILPAQQKLTLQECVDIALENNRNIRQQELTKQSRIIAYNQARADLLPNLNGSMSQNFSFGRSLSADNTYKEGTSRQSSFSAGISTGITLFDGLRMKYNIDARLADMNASEADMQKMQDDIVMSVSTAFLQVLLNKELLQIATDQIDLTKANLERRKELVINGKMAKGELYELEAQQAKEELNRVQAENNLKLSLLDLAQIMEMENFTDFDVTAPTTETLINEGTLLSSETIYESALLNRPEIRRDKYRLESNEKQALMAKAQYYPTLTMGANIGTSYFNTSGFTNPSFSSQMRDKLGYGFGFNLQIPIFNRFQVKNSVKNAQLTVENSRIEIDKLKIELRKRVEQAYYNALAAQSRWLAAQKSETASREAYRFAEQKFENGRANPYELFQAKSNLTQVLGEQTQAKYEYAFRLKILELLKN